MTESRGRWPGHEPLERLWVPIPRFLRVGLLTFSDHFTPTISTSLATFSFRLPFPDAPSQFANSLLFNALPPRSNDMQKVIDKQCTFVLFSRVFANQNPGLFTLSLEGLVSFQLASPFVPSATTVH